MKKNLGNLKIASKLFQIKEKKGSKGMNGKRLFWYSVGLKLMIIFFVISLAWGHKLISQKWFDPTVSESDKIFAIQTKQGNVNARNEFGLTGLMVAAQEGSVERFKALMFAGADPTLDSYDRPSAEGKTIPADMAKATVVHVAVLSANTRPQEEIEILKFLFTFIKARSKEGKETIDIPRIVNKKNAAGNPALQFVNTITLINTKPEQEPRTIMLNLLLENGADFNAQNSVGDTFLFDAVRRNDRPWVKLVLDNDRYKKLLKKDLKNKDGYNLKELAKVLNLTDMLAAICLTGIWECTSVEQRGVDTPRG